jgi:hypothetical protein
MNHQPAQRPNRVTAIFEHARIAFDMARGVTLAQLAEQLATLGEIHGGLPLSIDGCRQPASSTGSSRPRQ